MVVLQSISFANYALTTKTTNIIYGSAPYLTFDGGRTRVTNTEALLGISLSDGRRFTPTTNNSSSTNPIVLPVAGQSFADIGMLVPTNTDSIALSSLIGTPYNYWGDDDGDGQGVNGVTATGSLNLSIVDRWGQAVARNEVLTNCKAPYKLTLSNDGGTLKTRYGVPNESRFSASNVTYYINPKAAPAVCGISPRQLRGYPYDQGKWREGLSADVWKGGSYGFLPQSFSPYYYGSNFPTTGANNLYFDLDIVGNNQALSWASVSHGGITATMTNSTSTSVRVTLTGPVTTESQWRSNTSGRIARPSLPQVFELVGRDSSGNAVVKYGFKLKQWFVNSGNYGKNHSSMKSWCNSLGYRLPNLKDLTNARCRSEAWGCQSATPTGPHAHYFSVRHIGAGFFTEWGKVQDYTGANFYQQGYSTAYWTNDEATINGNHLVLAIWLLHSYYSDEINGHNRDTSLLGVCAYP